MRIYTSFLYEFANNSAFQLHPLDDYIAFNEHNNTSLCRLHHIKKSFSQKWNANDFFFKYLYIELYGKRQL